MTAAGVIYSYLKYMTLASPRRDDAADGFSTFLPLYLALAPLRLGTRGIRFRIRKVNIHWTTSPVNLYMYGFC